MTNKLSEDAFNQILLQIAGKKLLDKINNADLKTRIEKCIALNNEEYSYALSLLVDYFPDSKVIIIQAQKRIKGLEAFLTLLEFI